MKIKILNRYFKSLMEQEQKETLEKIEKNIVILKGDISRACSMVDDARADAETAKTFTTFARNDISDAKANAELAIDLVKKTKTKVNETEARVYETETKISNVIKLINWDTVITDIIENKDITETNKKKIPKGWSVIN